jgi:hypothetical protein
MPETGTGLKTNRSRFFFGCIGGLSIYAVKLAVLTATGVVTIGAELPHVGGLYIAGVIVTVLLGGVASYALESHNALIAIYHGATSPAMFTFLVNIHLPSSPSH